MNPLLSLTDKEVYNIPVLLVVGWRGEPGVHDEPQHVKQGKVTIPLLDTMGIKNEVLTADESELQKQIERAANYMKETKESFALVVCKGTFDKYELKDQENPAARKLTQERFRANCLNIVKPWAKDMPAIFSPWAPWVTPRRLLWASP